MSSTTVADSTSLPSASPAKPPTKQEALKAGSGHLHDPLAAELGNALPSFTDPAVQILKFHGSYQQDDRDKRRKGAEKDWQMMLRLRNPGGRIPTSLYLALDTLADRLGNGTLRITTRQAFQMHGVLKTDLKEVIGGIVRALGSTLSACGDINRNVMAPAAPFERDGYPEARLLADQIADLLAPQAAEGSYLDLWVDGDLSYRIKPKGPVKKARKLQESGVVFSGDSAEPLYGATYLPRKFKVAVTVPGDNSVDLLTQDIGLVLFSDPSGRPLGCNVYVGGGMGRTHNKEETFARTADPLGYVAAAHVLELVQAIVALQRDHGDREQRRHARMKYLIHDRGVDWFRTELGRYFPHPIKGMRREPTAVLTDYLGWHRQSPGLWFVGLPVLCGRLQGDLKTGLRRLIETYQLEVRLTPNQDLLLCNIGSAQRVSVRQALAELGLTSPEAPPALARHALACPALPLCGLAVTEAERVLPDVLARLDALLERLEISKPLLVRMTGCPNGCARPYMAEIGLVGSAVDTYQLWLGGSHGLTRLARPYLEKMPLEELEATLEPLLTAWRDKGGPRSRFGDFTERLGDQRVRELLSPA
ncbi:MULTISPECIES: sulfite reductase, ferredoxin dependent [unclassified Cyanobium]|uniref:sulfite reductase, ferredoxin dependent n=1 Tax=unclassified Cyanobium TaxID=2627006 RepID=UPI0020CD1EC3|nr:MULTISPECIES: sulfite reductase, ferredoxin dependent [unclassified Cyanobium]MCP9833100.1 sulfite reductase, ferredoxin dependent [Cyanobium sp. La Preciosa 7G6]MCP9936037.1 sulfite reductase, ferredoxin dependent [Cyanobium sp. Aljojuca 7A6]